MTDAAQSAAHDEFPCKLTINIPFPTHRLANIAIRALQVDQELSSLVTRSYTLTRATEPSANGHDGSAATHLNDSERPIIAKGIDNEERVLEVVYAATTNRMLRVAVNGFFESLKLVVECMEDLDVDVIMNPSEKSLQAVQGLAEVKWRDPEA